MIYYFIENLTELDPNEEITFSDNLVLKAIPLELQSELKQLIKQYHPHDRTTFFEIKRNDFLNTFHEYEKTADLPLGGISIKLRKKEDFRYFILQERNVNKFNLIYAQAFALCDKDFFMPFSFAFNQNSVIRTSFSELCIFTYYNDINTIDIHTAERIRKKKNPNSFKETDKLQILDYIELLTNFENVKTDYPTISKSLKDFFLTFEISDYSVFKIVSYIACLELLLVDNSFDKLKSISGQLQTKLNLLNNQFDKPIIIDTYFKGPDTLTLGKVIETIYHYRSSVAHGDFLDFSKKLQILQALAPEDILSFVRTVLKKVLIYSLKNPKLVCDLKKC
jgi:hypothetical protein